MEMNNCFFITGASGFFGSIIAKKIAAFYPNACIRFLQHAKPVARISNNCQIVRGSLSDFNIDDYMRDCDTIIHCAALTAAANLRDYWSVNVEGTRNLIEAAKRAHVQRFFFISTRSIGAECGAYGASKKAAEDILIQSGIPSTIFRFSELYGPSSNEGIMKLIRLIRAFPIIPYPSGDVRFAPLWQDDAVTAIITSLRTIRSMHAQYTLCGPHEYDFPELIRIITDHYSLKRIRIKVPRSFIRFIPVMHPDQFQRMICKKKCDNSAARTDLGFDPIEFDKGLSLL